MLCKGELCAGVLIPYAAPELSIANCRPFRKQSSTKAPVLMPAVAASLMRGHVDALYHLKNQGIHTCCQAELQTTVQLPCFLGQLRTGAYS